jgi:peptidoglycan/LPS O-acetylase OafA/YrhL
MSKKNFRQADAMYRPDIDGLRAIAVLSVITYHAFPEWLTGGFTGVDVFFVISGYLITTIIQDGLRRGAFSITGFYARRIRRIFPALILVLGCCLFFGAKSLLSDELNQLGWHTAAGAGFLSNLLLLNEVGYFDSAAEAKPLLHLWRLGVEEQFYLMWPVILWVANRRGFNLLIVTTVLTVTSFILNLYSTDASPVSAFYLPQYRFWELLSGGVLAAVVARRSNQRSDTSKPPQHEWASTQRLANLASTSGLLVVITGFVLISKTPKFPGLLAVLPVSGTCLLISGGRASWVSTNILSNKLLVLIGLISFPLYLWHWPLLSFTRMLLDRPDPVLKFTALAAAFLLAWLTYHLVERPFRYGREGAKHKTMVLCSSALVIGIIGIFVGQHDFSGSHDLKTTAVSRKSFEHGVGSSMAWFQGKGNWLFLGNNHDNTVSKLKLSAMPTEDQIQRVTDSFTKVAKAGAKAGTKIVLIIGPDKPSIYPEFLPDAIKPSPTRYVSFFTNRLARIPNLIVYDPTEDLLAAKNTEGLLYWTTDTHWNSKGAYLAYSGFTKLVNVRPPAITFKRGPTHSGDLIALSKLKDFPLDAKDNWDPVWAGGQPGDASSRPTGPTNASGHLAASENSNPISGKTVWVIGDSFANALKPYFNATFAQARYSGHWRQSLEKLPSELERAEVKPDLIVIVRVERSF